MDPCGNFYQSCHRKYGLSEFISEPYVTFMTLLCESDKEAKNRAEVSDKLISQISDVIKEFNKEKMATAKKVSIIFGY